MPLQPWGRKPIHLKNLPSEPYEPYEPSFSYIPNRNVKFSLTNLSSLCILLHVTDVGT